MERKEEGILLESRPYGEKAFILHVFTEHHGRCVGLSRKNFQIGIFLQGTWRARLESHLGFWKLETLPSPKIFSLLNRPLALLSLLTFCALCRKGLAERHPYPHLYEASLKLFNNLGPGPLSIAKALIQFEVTFLKESGFALQLNACAVTGKSTSLTHVSPVTGRAVCADVALPYENRLLNLPSFLTSDNNAETSKTDILHGFHLTSYFLERNIFNHIPGGLPSLRTHLIKRLMDATS